MRKKLVIAFFTVLSVPLILGLSGNQHLYKTLEMTLFKGRISPSILEYKHFPGRIVKAASYEPWRLSNGHNRRTPSPALIEYMESYDTRAFLVIKNDSILYEKYWEGFSDTTWSNSFSMAKSLVSLCVGVALSEGLIQSLDDPMANYLEMFNTPQKNQITIRHMLSMSSGMNYSESYLNPFGFAAKANYGQDLYALLSKYSANEEPGKIFKYQSGDTQCLAFLIKAVSGKSLSEYFSEKIWSQIGTRRDALWSLDREKGDEKAFCCFNSNARDFARIGKLMLQNGKYFNKQLIDSNYIQLAVQAADIVELNGEKNRRYGYQWWLGTFHNRNVFYARGINGQYIFCVPSENMIVVRLGFKRASVQIDGHPEDTYKYLQAALEVSNAEV